jgi:hypothetical protein
VAPVGIVLLFAAAWLGLIALGTSAVEPEGHHLTH